MYKKQKIDPFIDFKPYDLKNRVYVRTALLLLLYCNKHLYQCNWYKWNLHQYESFKLSWKSHTGPLNGAVSHCLRTGSSLWMSFATRGGVSIISPIAPQNPCKRWRSSVSSAAEVEFFLPLMGQKCCRQHDGRLECLEPPLDSLLVNWLPLAGPLFQQHSTPSYHPLPLL